MSLATPSQPLPIDGPTGGRNGPLYQMFWRNGFPLIAVTIFGLLVSYGAYQTTSNRDLVGHKDNFEKLAQKEIGEIQVQILQTTAALRSLRGLFNASDNVTRGQFKKFIDSLETDVQVQALEWIPRVPLAERAAYERAAVADGLANYRFTERDAQGQMARAGERNAYYPVYFVEPLDGNRAALGFDLGSNATRLAALNQARASGQPVASARITLVQETGDQFGFLIFIPVYRGGVVPETQQQREADLAGFGLGVFRMGDLVGSVVSRDNRAAGDIDIFVFDELAPRDSQLLYPKGASTGTSDSILATLRSEVVMEFAGRQWRIVAVPAKNSVFEDISWTAWLVFALGVFATALATLYVNVVLGRSRFADQLVDERTAELVRSIDERELILQKLTKSNVDLESFTYVASHDLKTPLRGIDNLISWITDDPDTVLSEESKNNAERLRTRIRRLEGLLDGLLEFSRSGRLGGNTKIVNSRELCEEIHDYLAPPDGLEILFGDDLPEFDTVKPALQTVLSNLIGNAIKHHDRSQGRVTISCADLGEAYRFTVSDDGPGIEPSHHKRIFEIFQTLAPRDKMSSGGIGLSIVAKIVDAAGGSITVESPIDKRGSAFHFTWQKIWPIGA